MSLIHDGGMELSAIDLNLLVSLGLLLEERSVTRAAARAGVTQSAMSHTLRRLREVFEDPLLVRGAGGMVLTPRAEALSMPVRRALRAAELAFMVPEPFDPVTSRRCFRLSMVDFLEALLLPPMLERLRAEAPGVDLDVVPVGAAQEALEAGEIDLAVGVDRAVGGGRRRLLFREGFACLVRRGHPGVGEVLDLETFVALPHVLIAPTGRGGGVVDTALEALGARRRVAVRVPQFMLAPWIVSRSDLILTAPRRLCEAVMCAHDLRMLPPPVQVGTFDVQMGWHERMHDDAGHRWLRGLIVELTAPWRSAEAPA